MLSINASRARAVKTGLLLTLALVPALLLAPLAEAGMPIVYNQKGKTVPEYATPSNWLWVANIPNSTQFRMKCWQDSYGYNGNYYSVRWFFGQAQSNGVWAWVPASYVYYQVKVPRC